MALCWTSLCSY